MLYNYVDRHAGTRNKRKTKHTISLDYNSFCYIASRIGWVLMKDGNLQVIVVDVILENCRITIVIVQYNEWSSR